MSRVYFPTYSLNRFGVRVASQRATLGAIQRFDNEPNPRAAMTPTGPMLGAIVDGGINPPPGGGPIYWDGRRWTVGRPIFYNGPVPISSSGGGGPVQPIPTSGGDGPGGPGGGYAGPPAGGVPPPPPGQTYAGGGSGPAQPFAPPTSSQTSPTPIATVPPSSPTSILLVSSGGGTQTPSTPTVVAAPSGGLVEGIAAWLGGTTSLFNYNVPNAVIAGVVVLGFALLSSSGKKK